MSDSQKDKLADEWVTFDYNYEDGQPVGMTYADVGRALAIWANCQNNDFEGVLISEAAKAFNMSELAIRRSVKEARSPFFFINGDQLEMYGL